MNNGAQVTGALPATVGSVARASCLTASLVDLGTLGGPQSEGLAINSAGDVVGTSDLSSGGPQHAFLYHAGQLIDPGTVESPRRHRWFLRRRSYIGDAGQIIVTSRQR